MISFVETVPISLKNHNRGFMDIHGVIGFGYVRVYAYFTAVTPLEFC